MELLSEDGWNFEKDYKSLGSFEVIAGTGFLGKSRKIELFQPNDSVFLEFSHCFWFFFVFLGESYCLSLSGSLVFLDKYLTGDDFNDAVFVLRFASIDSLTIFLETKHFASSIIVQLRIIFRLPTKFWLVKGFYFGFSY